MLQSRRGEFLGLHRSQLRKQRWVLHHQPQHPLLRLGGADILITQLPFGGLGSKNRSHGLTLRLFLLFPSLFAPLSFDLRQHGVSLHTGKLRSLTAINLPLHRTGQGSDERSCLLQIGHFISRVLEMKLAA